MYNIKGWRASTELLLFWVNKINSKFTWLLGLYLDILDGRKTINYKAEEMISIGSLALGRPSYIMGRIITRAVKYS